MKTIEITSAKTGEVIFSNTLENNTMALTILEAIKYGYNLKDANFNECFIEGATFTGVDFSGSDFQHSCILRCEFINCNFDNCDFDYVDSYAVKMVNVSASNVSFVESKFSTANKAILGRHAAQEEAKAKKELAKIKALKSKKV